jgi:hypothetical protein
MIFATQTPKGIDNKIVSNCTTWTCPSFVEGCGLGSGYLV